jgi:16S rRNA (adenine1518-N6/adenine1519-N6)-dimethyltransferase
VDRLSSLAAVGATREVLQAHGLATKHALGQNFLVNDDVIKKIATLADLQPDDFVLEVGPGIGTLTEALLKCSGAVISVERDHDLPAVLAETLSEWADRFALIRKDALELQLDDVRQARMTIASAMGGVAPAVDPNSDVADETAGGPLRDMPNKFVSNLPYAVAATIILDFFERFDSIQSAIVMVQREVGERIMAKPGTKNYGAYTVKLGLHAQAVDKFAVSPGNFFPPPHVESMVVRLDRRSVAGDDGAPLSAEEMQAAAMMADAAFATRRKTISNSCKTYFSGRGKPQVVAALPAMFDACGIAPNRRGETLEQAEFIRLGKALLAL